MKESASSSFQSPDEGQHAGAHAGLAESSHRPLGAVASVTSGQAPKQALSPITARPVYLGEVEPSFEVVDRDGLVLTVPLTGRHSSAAIARLLDLYARGDGLCLFHLTETFGGRCIDCLNGWNRHLLSAAPR